MLRFAIILLFALAATWWVLSGFTKPILLTLGAISIVLTVIITGRMKLLDRETAPYASIHTTLAYFVWLFGEVIKANLAVVRQILSPDLEVTPTLTKIPTAGKSDIARTMFANSITLTPGTVSADLSDEGHSLLVHVLHTDDPDSVRDDIKSRYERRLKEIFA